MKLNFIKEKREALVRLNHVLLKEVKDMNKFGLLLKKTPDYLNTSQQSIAHLSHNSATKYEQSTAYSSRAKSASKYTTIQPGRTSHNPTLKSSNSTLTSRADRAQNHVNPHIKFQTIEVSSNPENKFAATDHGRLSHYQSS